MATHQTKGKAAPGKSAPQQNKTNVPAQQQRRAVATTDQKTLPTFLKDKVKADAGAGTSTLQEDNLVPLVYILQGLSPQVNKRNEAYIDGAEPGHIWLRNSQDPIVAGEEGFLFQPCYFGKEWVEWVPRDDGGGLVGRYDDRPETAEQVPDPRDEKKMIWKMPNGNELRETRYHSGYVHLGEQRLPYVVPFSSTGHSVSREWMFQMNSRIEDGVKVPTYACLYRLTTRHRKNNKGEWYVFKPEFAGYVQSDEDYQAGKELHEAFATGAKRAETADDIADVAADDNGGDDGAM